MKLHTPFLIALLVLAGCSCEPAQQVPEDKMLLVLRDMQMAHLYVYNAPWPNARKDTVGAQLYASILATHDVDREDLAETLRYFEQNPSEFEKLVGRAVDSANVQASTLQARQPARPTATPAFNIDSLQQAKRDSLRSGGRNRWRKEKPHGVPGIRRRIPNQQQ